jgi:hypothetical protein
MQTSAAAVLAVPFFTLLGLACARGTSLHRGAERSARLGLERVLAGLDQLTHPFGNPHGTSGFLGLEGVRSFIRIMTMNWF